MSQIDDLIAKLCPNGVDFRAIGDFGELVRGNGMPKADFVESGVGCIHYGQIYTYYGIWTAETKSFVPEEKAEKLAKVDPGDLVITNTSENIEDVCKAVAWIGETQIVTGGHATVLKHDQDPKYLSYYLQTPHFFAEKKKHATGTKVIDVSAKSLAKIRIPVPPLEVQREIVKVLDTFTQLEAELEAELEARRRQYKYYRDALLTFGERTDADASKQARITTVGEIYESSSGLSKGAEQFGFGHPFLSFKTVFNNPTVPVELSDLVNTTEVEQARYSIKKGDVFVTRTSEDIEGLGMSCAALSDYPKATFNGFTKRLRPKEEGVVDPQFAAYFFRSSHFRTQIAQMAVLSTRVSLNDDILLRIRIPIPSIEEQRRIVSILDKFDALVNDLSCGLPAEIKARRQQYEHYRNRLLSFREAA